MNMKANKPNTISFSQAQQACSITPQPQYNKPNTISDIIDNKLDNYYNNTGCQMPPIPEECMMYEVFASDAEKQKYNNLKNISIDEIQNITKQALPYSTDIDPTNPDLYAPCVMQYVTTVTLKSGETVNINSNQPLTEIPLKDGVARNTNIDAPEPSDYDLISDNYNIHQYGVGIKSKATSTLIRNFDSNNLKLLNIKSSEVASMTYQYAEVYWAMGPNGEYPDQEYVNNFRPGNTIITLKTGAKIEIPTKTTINTIQFQDGVKAELKMNALQSDNGYSTGTYKIAQPAKKSFSGKTNNNTSSLISKLQSLKNILMKLLGLI